MCTCEAIVNPATEERAERRTWIGEDDRGLELEIGECGCAKYTSTVEARVNAAWPATGEPTTGSA